MCFFVCARKVKCENTYSLLQALCTIYGIVYAQRVAPPFSGMPTLQLMGCALLVLVAQSPTMDMDEDATHKHATEDIAAEFADMAPFTAASPEAAASTGASSSRPAAAMSKQRCAN